MDTILTRLAKQYKKDKDRKILNDIFKELSKSLKEKSKYIFYQQKFIRGHYNTEKFNKNINKFENQERVKTFRLCDTKKMDLEDIENDINLFVLELLEKYDVSLPFDNYLYASLKDWRPDFIRKGNFIKGLEEIKESDLPEQNETEGVLPEIAVYPIEEIEAEDLFDNLTSNEKKYVEIKLKFPNKNQTEIAEIIGVTQQMISLLEVGLRKKYNRHL